jgi:hypothetical protein
MILKSFLDAIRHYIVFIRASSFEHLKASQFAPLWPLVNLKDDNDDFFASFLAIKLKTRQKALKMISTRVGQINNYKAV